MCMVIHSTLWSQSWNRQPQRSIAAAGAAQRGRGVLHGINTRTDGARLGTKGGAVCFDKDPRYHLDARYVKITYENVLR